MRPRAEPPGFTLIELLVVISIMAMLAAVLLPSLSRAKNKARGVVCLNHLKQLSLAWQLYSLDHHDQIPPNAPWEWDAPECYWVRGKMDFTLDNTDNTNTLFLTGGYLGPYHRSARIFKDPADRSVADLGGRLLPRVRTVSMNMWMGGCGAEAWNASYRVFAKTSDIAAPPPSSAFVFIIQREDAIEDAWYRIDMEDGGTVQWPGFYHNGSDNLSFADGHVDARKWVDPQTTPRMVRGEFLAPQSGWFNENQDAAWLRERATSEVQ